MQKNPFGFERLREQFHRYKGTPLFSRCVFREKKMKKKHIKSTSKRKVKNINTNFSWKWLDYNNDGDVTVEDFELADQLDAEEEAAEAQAHPQQTFFNMAPQNVRIGSKSIH